jgi:hypothetical protein
MRKLLIIQEEGVGDSVIQDNCDEKAIYCLNKAISCNKSIFIQGFTKNGLFACVET